MNPTRANLYLKKILKKILIESHVETTTKVPK